MKDICLTSCKGYFAEDQNFHWRVSLITFSMR